MQRPIFIWINPIELRVHYCNYRAYASAYGISTVIP